MELAGGGEVVVWSDRRDWWLDRVYRETHRNVGLVELFARAVTASTLAVAAPRLRKGK